MGYPWATAEEVDVPGATQMSEFNQRQNIAGENLDSSGANVPIPVYVKTSDSKVYKTDNDADESTFKFKGFVGEDQNVLADASVNVITDGVVGGFSGLTTGDPLYISSVSGELTTSPNSTRIYQVAVAISSTQILIKEQSRKIFKGSDILASGTADQSNTISVGFRPKKIEFIIDANDANEVARSFGSWADGAFQGIAFGNTGAFDAIETTNLLTNQFTDGRMEIDVSNFTETGFDINYDRSGGANASQATVYFIVTG